MALISHLPWEIACLYWSQLVTQLGIFLHSLAVHLLYLRFYQCFQNKSLFFKGCNQYTKPECQILVLILWLSPEIVSITIIDCNHSNFNPLGHLHALEEVF